MLDIYYISRLVFIASLTDMSNSSQIISEVKNYCNSLTKYLRRQTREVKIGNIALGGNNPIRVQSMTTVDTMDTKGTVEQSIRMIEAGCDYVRITAPSLREAENLSNIKAELRNRGFATPLIADIHFTPNAAELAARIVEKVRVNPGNYADKKKFENIRYTNETYLSELDRIREKFTPLVKICKEYGTAMRIGTNHGSLSDRIMSRYGDTPLGMVESALEFLRICEDLNYYDIVLSMKASNPQVMIQAYRLLVNRLDEEGLQPYPLHLGVTEAGEGEDGRIKSAIGIGTLLEDGLGDTVRVSLTEEPEVEVPVAQKLVDRYNGRQNHEPIPEVIEINYNPFSYSKRSSREVLNIGGLNVPRVISDFRQVNSPSYFDLKAVGHIYLADTDKFIMNDKGVDYIYSGSSPVNFMLPSGLRELIDYDEWLQHGDFINAYPVFKSENYLGSIKFHDKANFIRLRLSDLNGNLIEKIKNDSTAIIILETGNLHGFAEQRRFFIILNEYHIDAPVIIGRSYAGLSREEFMLFSATDFGALLADGFGDGIILFSEGSLQDKVDVLNRIRFYNNTAFGILQASRSRITRTEYISCPSCGRTLFDLQETTGIIRKKTDHLKGVKIAIMGCIVNGPGEMADADYGYVGSGKGKVSLYRGKNIVKRNVPTENAVDELMSLIREDGKWTEPST